MENCSIFYGFTQKKTLKNYGTIPKTMVLYRKLINLIYHVNKMILYQDL